MKIHSTKAGLKGEINIPGSKSHTIRAVAIATMAEGTSVLREALDSADTRASLSAARAFGAEVQTSGNNIIITGIGKKCLPEGAFIDVANSGTTLRIFTALASLYNVPVTFDGDSSIRKRLMTNLFNALEALGAKAGSSNQKCPFTITGPIAGSKTIVDGLSSQFVTALLFAAPLAKNDIEIQVVNLHEKPYVQITLNWLDKQGIKYENKGLEWFKVKGGQAYKPFDERIAADFSSATFALVAAAVTGSEIKILGLDFNDQQGDKQVFSYLRQMGMKIDQQADGVVVKGGKLTGIEINMNDTPDALPAMAVAGCFATGTTKLLNVAQARLKECDRISAVARELRKMGANIEELPDGLIVHQSELNGTRVHGYDDHRMVMSLAIAGMAADGVTEIDTAESVSVTYPTFIDDFNALGANIKITEK
ncbi:MAG: 3-phosphoshikimate 1-carboxyvinyltransferase [Bacteroidales bacterium]|nr:3-phosphoshikimate 1-carboxyvinyltransferase [Bacteroidales bacterium]